MLTYPIQVQFDGCNLPLILEHQYTVQYETSFDNDYNNGEVICKDDKITSFCFGDRIAGPFAFVRLDGCQDYEYGVQPVGS